MSEQNKASAAALTLIREKLERFEACAGDDEGCDIGREWFDALTTLGLLERTQRSPALWSMTPAGEALLAAQPAADAPSDMGQDDISEDCPHDTCDPAACQCAEPAHTNRQGVALSERDAFEKVWLYDEGAIPGCIALERDPAGDYRDLDTNSAWEAWQSACKWQREALSRASSSQTQGDEQCDGCGTDLGDAYCAGCLVDEPAKWLQSIKEDGYRTDNERCAAEILLKIANQPRASSSRAEVESEAGLGAALMDVCLSLPRGCGVVINAENGWAGVTFCDADGNEFDMDDGETSITNQVRNALAAAEAPKGDQS